MQDIYVRINFWVKIVISGDYCRPDGKLNRSKYMKCVCLWLGKSKIDSQLHKYIPTNNETIFLG